MNAQDVETLYTEAGIVANGVYVENRKALVYSLRREKDGAHSPLGSIRKVVERLNREGVHIEGTLLYR